MEFNPDILSGKKCPYCGSSTEYVDSKMFYNKSYGMVYACIPCNAWVGVHRGTNIALGRLANEELRQWKKAAHSLFDPLWKQLLNHGKGIRESRKACYYWLSQRLSIPFGFTHIGMFDVEQCKATCEAIKELLEGEGLQAILTHDETVSIVHPLNQKNTVDIEQLSLTGRDQYFREVYSTLEEYAMKHDFKVEALQFTQYRISGRNKILDIYPVSRKYHDVTGNKRGNYGYLKNYLNNHFETGKPNLEF